MHFACKQAVKYPPLQYSQSTVVSHTSKVQARAEKVDKIEYQSVSAPGHDSLLVFDENTTTNYAQLVAYKQCRSCRQCSVYIA